LWYFLCPWRRAVKLQTQFGANVKDTIGSYKLEEIFEELDFTGNFNPIQNLK